MSGAMPLGPIVHSFFVDHLVAVKGPPAGDHSQLPRHDPPLSVLRRCWAKTAIADKLQMSRNTVDSLLKLKSPPCYERAKKGSILDRFEDAISAMLSENPKVAATVILERLRPLGYAGGITVLKDRLQKLRPAFIAAASYQRTSYLPGEISQLDWWHTGVGIPTNRSPFAISPPADRA
jgi:transposase